MRGKLIVFEGTDGSGKATQVKLLDQRLTQEGLAHHVIDFPRYGNPFAQPVQLYLNGRLGDKPGDVNAYAASVFFAVDRYASYKEDWGGAYEAGELILANRYTTSNAVHQASKLPGGEREAFLDWLFDLEYRRLELPEPDLVIYLDVPTDLTEGLLRRREAATGAAADIHERDDDYLRQCRENARQVAARCRWQRICCAENGVLRTVEDIHQEAWALVRDLLEKD
jgi:dTMP kinase